jgi:PAS domain S-box-containing protein
MGYQKFIRNSVISINYEWHNNCCLSKILFWKLPRAILEIGKEMLELKRTHNELELRVRERTADLAKVNEELQLEITERERVEAALREAEERFYNLSEQSGDAIYITTREGEIVYINQSFLNLFGYTREDITDLNAKDTYVNPDDRSRFRKEIKQKGAVKDFEVKLRRKDGAEMDCLITANVRRANDGRILGYQGIIRDITEHKRAEEKIKEYSRNLERMVELRTRRLNQALYDAEEARDRIDGILRSVADGLIVTDIDNRIILINRAAEALLGVRSSEIINRPVDFAIQEETLRDRIMTTLDKKETGYQFDFELPGEDTKHPRIMRARTSVIQAKSGEQTCIVTIIQDVTQEREVDRMKTEFISTAAHELRTPLTSIRGFSEILLTRDDINGKERNKFLSYINKQSVNLANIITDLLDISRIESSLGSSLKKTPCNIADIIRGVIPYFQEQSPKHIFEVVLPEESVEVMVDKEKIGQVLENILSNAVKYSPEGGPICLSVKLILDCALRIADSDDDSDLKYTNSKLENRKCVEISVSDTGTGMTPGQVKKIFNKFYRANASNTAVPGTGLGMSIVKNLVEAHGGMVWVESKLAKGTTVRFTIPIQDFGSRNGEEIRNDQTTPNHKGGAER